MDESRRNFLKIAGCGALGVGWSIPVFRAIGKTFETEAAAEALTVKKNWAMVVDIARCQQEAVARACIDACHLAHNVPDIGDPKEEIKWIWREPVENAFPTQLHEYSPEALRQSRVLVFCNHCQNPPCTKVCPTQATWKRKEDGLVMMDPHRCIGCRYCMAACPYGSRSFNFKDPRPYLRAGTSRDYPPRTKGVVEKCNFCAERLARGLQPACVEACSQVDGGAGALLFGDLGDPSSEIVNALRTKNTIRRKPFLGTEPQVYYVV